MSNPDHASQKTIFKVGAFTLAGILAVFAITVFVNDRPYWWRSCQPVTISVEDATGLKAKSPVRSLGIEIGYLQSVQLSETMVSLGICLTAPVEVLPATRAYIRAEGFLGDKFVELKPVRYLGKPVPVTGRVWDLLIPSAYAEEGGTPLVAPTAEAQTTPSASPARRRRTSKPQDSSSPKEIPVGEGAQDMQKLVGHVDGLVQEMTNLTNNLKEALHPEELKAAMKQLNKTLENASKTLAPDGGLNRTAQRTLGKLEDAIEQMRDQLTRINQGQGSVGRLLNDPAYADDIREMIRNANKLLNKVSDVRFGVDIGGQIIKGYSGGRGYFGLAIWPSKTRYYRLGISVDPRGRRTEETITTTAGGISTVVRTERVETTGILLTGMVGTWVWNNRLDLSLGALHGDGNLRIGLNLGPKDAEDRFQITNDFYSHSGEESLNYRATALIRPVSIVYLTGGLDSIRKVSGKMPYLFGAGISFDDDDIKLLFALR